MKDFNEDSSSSKTSSGSSDSMDASLNSNPNIKQRSLLEISNILQTIFSRPRPKSFYNEANYLHHAQLAVDALKSLFLKTSTAAQAQYPIPEEQGQPLFQKIIHELNEIYEALEDYGWQCAQEPLGLIPSSSEGFKRFMGAVLSKSAQISAANIFGLCQQLESLRTNQHAAPESLAQTAQTDIRQLVKKIKADKELTYDPLIIENPNIVYQSDNQETQANELGFTPLFYAAKYSTDPNIFRTLLFHITLTQDKKYLITKPLNELQNPLFNTKPIMLCAHYAEDRMLEALLATLTLKQQQKEVSSVCNKGAFNGWSALHFACYNTGNRMKAREDACKKVERLLALGADLNAVTQTSPAKDALILAIETGHTDLIRLLISRGIQTPLTHPELNHIQIIKNSRFSDAEKKEFIEYISSLERVASASASVGLGAEKEMESVIQQVGDKRKSSRSTSDAREELLEHFDNPAKKSQVQQTIASYTQTHNLKLGKAFGDGDCFFDSFSQGLQVIFPDQGPRTVSQLRQICALEATKPNQWLAQELTQEHQSVENYPKQVKFCKNDFRYGKIGSQTAPMWGRPNIEGRLLCQHFNVNLHVTEVCEVEGDIQLMAYDINAHAQDHEQRPTIHIMVSQHTLHFVPLIPKELDIIPVPVRMSKYTRPGSFGAAQASSSFFNEDNPNPNKDDNPRPQKK